MQLRISIRGRVRPSVHPSVGPSVRRSHFAFFAFLGSLRVGKFVFEHAPAQIITAPAQIIIAPAQLPAIGAVVYTALFLFILNSFFLLNFSLAILTSFYYISPTIRAMCIIQCWNFSCKLICRWAPASRTWKPFLSMVTRVIDIVNTVTTGHYDASACRLSSIDARIKIIKHRLR